MEKTEKIRKFLLNEDLTLFEIAGSYSYKELKEIFQVGEEIHYKMHIIESEGSYYENGTTPEKWNYEHSILVTNLKLVSHAILVEESCDIVKISNHPLMYFHAN